MGSPILCDTCTSEQGFGRATIHMIEYLRYNVFLTRLEMSLRGIYHSKWGIAQFSKKVAEALKISPQEDGGLK